MTKAQTRKVTIIVASRNNEDTINDCLKSLFSLHYPLEAFEVIVIDGCSTDRTVQIAKQYPAKVISLPLNAPAAYNYAMKISSHSILGFVDADAKVEENWLSKLIVHLSEPKVAGVSGAIETWNVESPWARSIGYELKNRYSRIDRYAGRIATMNLLLKRRVIEEAGGWDETLPSQYDTDMGYRITSLGYKIAYEPEAKCYHHNRQTLGAYWRQQLQYGKNTLKLYFKHSKLAKGDAITDWGMNLQPPLLLAIILLFLLGIVPVLRPLWIVSGALFVGLLVYYEYSALKITYKYKDSAALRLMVLYFVRAFAWLAGAAVTVSKFILGNRGEKQRD